MRALVLAICLLACKRDAVPPPSSLWTLAPDDLMFGAVVTANALARLDGGMADVRVLAEKAPELAAALAAWTELEAKLQRKLGLAELGLTGAGGGAVFVREDRKVIFILPVADRRKLVGALGGKTDGDVDTIDELTCKQVMGVYACAVNARHFAYLGKGGKPALLASLGSDDIEVAFTPKARPSVAAVIHVNRGGFTARAVAKDVPPPVLALASDAKVQIEPAAAGFVFASLDKMLALGAYPTTPIVEGIPLATLVKSLAGPLTLTVATGASSFDARIPLHDPAPVRALLAQCDKVPELAAFGAKAEGSCHLENALLGVKLDGWLDGTTLRIADRSATAAGTPIPRSRLGEELATGTWTFAGYGRGTVFAPTSLRIPPEAFPDDDLIGLRILTLTTELGMGLAVKDGLVHGAFTLRTIWENPDDVVAKLTAIELAAVRDGSAVARAQAIAEAAPRSPFAADFRAGMVSMLVPFVVMGGIQEQAVAAVGRYVKW